MMRPFTQGPRSFTRTRTERPFSRFVTSRSVPRGSVGCAAVSLFMSKGSPLDGAAPLVRGAVPRGFSALRRAHDRLDGRA